jgi:hypothetical protein
MIGNLSTSLTNRKLPTLAEIERRRHEPLTQAGLRSQHQTSPASPDPASPPASVLPTPEPLPASARAAHPQSDQALERLSSLELATSRYVFGRGRHVILWSAIDREDELMKEETAEPEESSGVAELVRLVRTF